MKTATSLEVLCFWKHYLGILRSTFASFHTSFHLSLLLKVLNTLVVLDSCSFETLILGHLDVDISHFLKYVQFCSCVFNTCSLELQSALVFSSETKFQVCYFKVLQ